MQFQQVQPDKNLCKMLLQNNNTMTWTSVETQEAIIQLGWLMLPHPSYCPGLTPLDFHLFRLLNNAVHGRKYKSDDDILSTIKTWLCQQDKE
jgi:histone-lysine N-methyltransferase SETMAR